ncbi:MAG: cupin domain-containing protein [Sphingopyxis sp.]
MPEAIVLNEKFASFDEHWRPKIISQANGQDVRIAKTKGVFPWHSHADAEEVFLCWRGQFRVEFRDHIVTLNPGEMLTVPRGVEHRTASDDQAEILIFEPSDVVNTGDAAISAFTAPAGVII